MNKIPNIKAALDFGKSELSKAGVADAALSSEILLSELLGFNKQQIPVKLDEALDEKAQEQFVNFISRRAKHEPIQYILGYAYFRGIKIQVKPGVLIPRPETEMLVENAIKRLKHNYNKILDLCTGSGCISCAFANEFSDLKIVATDISDDAIQCAKENVKLHNFQEKIELLHCNMADEVYDNDFDLIISNPPYVPTDVYKNLDAEVLDFEPKLALEAGGDGLRFLPEIIEVAKDKLKPGGLLALELHEDSLETAAEMAKKEGLENIETLKDLANKNRFLLASIS